ncbi:hypothetical protein [Nitrococcus mobilis]|uniref:Aminoglycoside phosphotransferase domain-containing protein n=1 Tax=Nitrococcus mobilis Nb-231 TaxID=314278 RepID=A4BQ22_9GAMM|nr:hypothetical protein [Nitrococcus mobilis]EAR22177.1 hypothetical protein NB231_04690 [Nitrococcus mobilis Nb-231]
MPSAALEAQRDHQRRMVDSLQRTLSQGSSAPVEVMETHLSWLLLSADQVIKLKKALHYSYLDYSTVEARYRQCQTEVRLNRRLAPDVYLAVSSVMQDERGALTLHGPGTAVEYVVRMRRLAETQNFDWHLQQRKLTPKAIDSLATTLARFHEQLPGLALDPTFYVEGLRRRISEDTNILAERGYGLDRHLVKQIAAALHSIAHDLEHTLQERVGAGQIVEGHGDLRPEHIYFTPEPVAIDCLEFNHSLRTLDAVDEVSLLAMECDRCGANWVRERLLRRYVEAIQDKPSEELCCFFMACRAMLWAKLAVWHLARNPEHDRDKWINRANEYLALARKYVL